jgi:putative drug exporter of the RND superfamily
MDFSRFILKRKKAIVSIWIVAFIIFLPLILNYGKFVSYSISSSALSDTESGKAQTLLNSFSPVNSSLTVVIPVNIAQANSTFTDLVNSTLAFQQAVNSSSIPSLQGSKSAFTDYQQFLNSILSANSQTIINTYQNISQLSSQVYDFPNRFLGNWSSSNYAQTSIFTTAQTAQQTNDNATYAGIFLQLLNSSYSASPSLDPAVRVQNATAAAAAITYINNSTNPLIFPVISDLNVTNYKTEILPVTAQVISQYSGNPTPIEVLKAVLSGSDPGKTYVTEYGLLNAPSFITQNYISPNNDTFLVTINFNVDDSYRGNNNFYPAQNATSTIRALATKYFGEGALVTGQGAIAYDTQSLTSSSGYVFGFTFIFLVIAVALTLRSALSSLLSLLFVSLATGLGYVAIYATGLMLGQVDFTVTYTLTAVILGVATDYLVFILSRYREELKNDKPREEAFRIATSKAGFAIVVSGLTVAGSLGALSFISNLRSWGPVLLISVLMTVALETTLLPAVVAIIGNRLFRTRPNQTKKPIDYPRSIFYKTARFSSGKRKKYLVAGLIILVAVPTFYLWFNLPVTYNFSEGLPNNLESVKGLNTINSNFGANLIYPTFVIANFSQSALDSNGSVTPEAASTLKAYSTDILQTKGVAKVIGATANGTQVTDPTNLTTSQFIFNNGQNAYFIIFTDSNPYSNSALTTINSLRSNPAFLVGGLTSSVIDLRNYYAAAQAELEVIILIVIAIVLGISLRKIYYPIISLSGVFISITWTTGILYLITKYILNQELIFLIPIVLYVILMSLGNDFTVFILTRVREEQANLGVRKGLEKAMVGSGAVVTSLGIILAVSLGSLAFVPYGFLQQVGIAFVISLLLDTFVIRTFYFPAMITIFNRKKVAEEALKETTDH